MYEHFVEDIVSGFVLHSILSSLSVSIPSQTQTSNYQNVSDFIPQNLQALISFDGIEQ